MSRLKVAFLGLLVILVLAAVVSCWVATARPASVPAPGPTEAVEVEDCDKEDQAKGQWWEGCTIAPVAPKTPAKPRTVAPRRTRR